MIARVPHRLPLDPTVYRLAPPACPGRGSSRGTADPTHHLSPLAATLLVELRALRGAPERVTAKQVVEAQTRLCQEHGHATRRLVRAAFGELLRSGDVVAVDGEVGG
jgi:hypothetical protein